MRNKEIIVSKIEALGYELGCYNDGVERISKKELAKVLEALEQEHTDIIISIRKKQYVVEVATVDNEKDLNIRTLDDYVSEFGDGILEE